ncbi:hypothetical protein D3C77_501240 [compost metagenome]
MKVLGLGLIGNDRCQSRQALEHLLLKRSNLHLEIRSLARLAEHCIDLHQIAQGFQVAAQDHAVAQQLKALQLDLSGMEFGIRIVDQVIVGHQHRQEKQNTDQAEFHPETQPIHQRDGRIQQTLHGWSPPILIVMRAQWH